MNIKSNDRVVVVGKTGSGKTTYVKHILFPMYPCKVFHDIKCDNTDLLNTCYLCTTPEQLRTALIQGRKAILYQPHDLSTDDFNQVCKVVYDAGNIALFVDEAATVCSSSWIEPWHNQIMIRGRSRGIGMINVTQRPRACHNTIFSESEHFFVFRLQLDTDISKIKPVIPKEYHNEISMLPAYHCIYSNNDGDIVRIISKI